MKIKKWLFIGLGFSFFSPAIGQEKTIKNLPIITLNDSTYYSSEFEKMYVKNFDVLADSSQKEIDNYLELYILYKIKLQEAYRLGLHTKNTYKEEVKQFENQLKEKYYINESKIHSLIQEAVHRSRYEVKASHILIKSVRENPVAYNKAIEIREKILAGMDFSEAALAYSEDPSAVKNKGNIGYFTVFNMVYPFENAAFSTSVGEISMPIKTEFGYHLVYVTDKRKIPQTREISHIFVKKTDEHSLQTAEKKAYQLYSQLQLGSNFSEIAATDSDDWAGRQQKGYIGKFEEKNFNIPNVGETIYSLKENEFSKPIKSNFGYHIFKVDKIHPYLTDEEAYFILENKVKRSDRVKVLEDELIDFLSKEYHFKADFEQLKPFITLKFISQPTMQLPKEKIMKNNVIEIDKGKWKKTNSDVLQWIYSNKYSFDMYDEDATIAEKAIEAYKLYILKKYHESKLPTKYPEYLHLLKEYKEGVLIYDLWQNEVLNKSKSEEEYLKKLKDKAQITINKKVLKILKEKYSQQENK